MISLRRERESVSFSANNQTRTLERGKLSLPKGKCMPWLALEFEHELSNASGSAVTLSKAQKIALLASFELTFASGKDGKDKPYEAIALDRMRDAARAILHREVEGFDDASTGLAQEIANSGSETVTYRVLVPTGAIQAVKQWRRRGMGRTQVESVTMQIRRGTLTLPTGVTSGDVTCRIVPVEASCKGDKRIVVAPLIESAVASRRLMLEDGLPLAVWETSAAHASTALTEVTTHVDDEVMLEQTAPGDYLSAVQGDPNLPTDADVSDRVTVLYSLPGEIDAHDVPTGRFKFYDGQNDLNSSISYVAIVLPYRELEKIQAELRYAASHERDKELRAVATHVLEDPEAPSRIAPHYGYTLFDAQDDEYDRYPGTWAVPNAEPMPYVPQHILEPLQASVESLEKKNAKRAAQELLNRTSLMVPGAVQSGRGIGKGSTVAMQIRELIRGRRAA